MEGIKGVFGTWEWRGGTVISLSLQLIPMFGLNLPLIPSSSSPIFPIRTSILLLTPGNPLAFNSLYSLQIHF